MMSLKSNFCCCRFMVHKLGKNKYIVQSVPGELSMEQTSILTLASEVNQSYVTQTMIMDKLG